MSDRAEWVRTHLPICAAAAATFAAAFPGTRMTYASENGYTIGKPTPSGVKLSDTAIGSFSAQEGKRK